LSSKSRCTPVIKLLRQVKDAYTTENIKQAKEEYESLIVADHGFHTYPGKVCHTTADRVPINSEFGNKQYAFLKILQTNQHITFPV